MLYWNLLKSILTIFVSNFIWDFTFIREGGLIGIFQLSSLSRKQRGMINVPPPKTLLIGTWNINVFRSKVFGNKFEQQDVQNIIKKYDIIGFTETHTSNDISLSLPAFQSLLPKTDQR